MKSIFIIVFPTSFYLHSKSIDFIQAIKLVAMKRTKDYYFIRITFRQIFQELVQNTKLMNRISVKIILKKSERGKPKVCVEKMYKMKLVEILILISCERDIPIDIKEVIYKFELSSSVLKKELMF